MLSATPQHHKHAEQARRPRTGSFVGTGLGQNLCQRTCIHTVCCLYDQLVKHWAHQQKGLSTTAGDRARQHTQPSNAQALAEVACTTTPGCTSGARWAPATNRQDQGNRQAKLSGCRGNRGHRHRSDWCWPKRGVGARLLHLSQRLGQHCLQPRQWQPSGVGASSTRCGVRDCHPSRGFGLGGGGRVGTGVNGGVGVADGQEVGRG